MSEERQDSLETSNKVYKHIASRIYMRRPVPGAARKKAGKRREIDRSSDWTLASIEAAF
jgi:hypothetical protein